jgi:hypothetical protein
VQRSTTSTIALDMPMAGESDVELAAKRRWLHFQRFTGREEGNERESGAVRRADAARVAGSGPAKSGDSISMMPALKQIGGIEFLLLAV